MQREAQVMSVLLEFRHNGFSPSSASSSVFLPLFLCRLCFFSCSDKSVSADLSGHHFPPSWLVLQALLSLFVSLQFAVTAGLQSHVCARLRSADARCPSETPELCGCVGMCVSDTQPVYCMHGHCVGVSRPHSYLSFTHLHTDLISASLRRSHTVFQPRLGLLI